MLKNFWPCICLGLLISPNSWANMSTLHEESTYDGRTPSFYEEEAELNEQDFVKEEEKPANIQNRTQPLKAKESDCVKDDCEDIDIVN